MIRRDIALAAMLMASGLLASPARAAATESAPPSFRSASSQFVTMKPAAPLPATALRALDGAPARLDALRGQVVLLNFWASWCLPCVYEMPALDRLAAAAPSGLAVVAVSIDQAGGAAVAPFAAAHGLAHLRLYLDPDQRLGSLTAQRPYPEMLPLWGLPITYVIDKRGRVAGYLTGAAAWDSPQARAFLQHFLDEPA